MLIFFLIYGVEVFFKIRGEFLYDSNSYHQTNNQTSESTTKKNRNNWMDINVVQVNHARFGLLSQAGRSVFILHVHQGGMC